MQSASRKPMYQDNLSDIRVWWTKLDKYQKKRIKALYIIAEKEVKRMHIKAKNKCVWA